MKSARRNDRCMIKIFPDYCKGCGLCIAFCPVGALKRSTNINKIGYYIPELGQASKCTVCGICEVICPDFAIVSVKDKY